jgi:hypothetical protein
MIKVKLLIECLEQIERDYPDSEVVIDIGRKDIYDWDQIQLVEDNLATEIAIGHTFISPCPEFPNGKNFVYIVPEYIVMR